MTTQRIPATGRGFQIHHLLIIAALFLALQLVSLSIQIMVGAALPQNFGLLTTAVLLEVGSWAAFPILSFVFVLALRRTEDLKPYLPHFLLFSVVMELTHDLAFSGKLWDFSSMSFIWAFWLCLVIWSVDKHVAKHKWLYVVACVFASVAWIFIGGIGHSMAGLRTGVLIVGFFLTFHYLWHRENTMMMTSALLGASFFLAPSIGVIFLHYRAPLLAEAGKLPRMWVGYVYAAALALVGCLHFLG